METVLDSVRRHARERGADLVYWTPARTWSFAQLDDASSRIAQGLKNLGIGAGDRVACLTKRTADCVALVLAANKIGAVCMPVNWRLAPPEIDYILANGQARLMMADAAFPYVKIKSFMTEEFSSWYGGVGPKSTACPPRPQLTPPPLLFSLPTPPPEGAGYTHPQPAGGLIGGVAAAAG